MDPDDQKKTRIERPVSTDSFIRAFPLPVRATPSAEEPKFVLVPSSNPAGAAPAKHWRIVFSPVEKPSEQLGIEIAGDVVLGSSADPAAGPDVNFASWQGEQRGVSLKHALLRPARDKLFLMDLGSTNGTHYNGMPLTTERVQAIEKGDLITLGRLHLRIKLVAQVDAPAAEAKPG